MKIGIMTWFNYDNYGTKLQAFALHKYISMLGNDVELINYIVDDSTSRSVKKESSLRLRLYKKIGWYILQNVKNKHSKDLDSKHKKLQRFITENCIVSKKLNDKKTFVEFCNNLDCVVTGSDQIWNPNWYSPFYYINFDEVNTDRISYASSFGVNTVLENRKHEIRKGLERFLCISVRENSAVEMLSREFNVDASLVVDPTMLLSSMEWKKYLIEKKEGNQDYIAVYLLSDNHNHWKAVKRFAKKMKLPLRIIPVGGYSYIQDEKIDYSIGIEDFLSIIYHSKIVITDSFHACVFSTLFGKQYLVFERFLNLSTDSQNTRIYSLLSNLECENILLPHNTNNIRVLPKIDYDRVNGKMESLVFNSKQYLVDALNKVRVKGE